MRYLSYAPGPPLSQFVELLWLAEGVNTSYQRERLLPTGSVELVINLLDEPMQVYVDTDATDPISFQHSVISGPHSRYFVLDTYGTTAVIGAHFRPGGAYPFVHHPLSSLRNLHVSLDTIWGRRGHEWRERILATPSIQQRFQLLEQALLTQLAEWSTANPMLDHAIHVLSAPHPISVPQLSDQLGIGPRRLGQLFQQHVGLSPKQFYRLQRFQHAVGQSFQALQVDWADLALQCGYYDQAHFSHDFRAFSGLAPGTYWQQRGRHPNHVPLDVSLQG
ncbi:helix-turn-helix domain-containing protein [Chitinivorax sp. B]|uniref:helix-turn-helix domain-containing protein n=1 Tax=Chitinivorax sp. B TaxID=2502235 RepID=UPI0010F8082F|nr:helix-turn-helix domain-containing protein [Chitinivorax sp. B]